MKIKFPLLVAFALFAFKGTSQNVYLNIPATGLSNMSQWMLQSNSGYAFRVKANAGTEKNASPASPNGTVTANWQKFTGSHNIYGVMNSSAKPLQYHPALNVVSFIHTKNTTYTSSPNNGRGDVVAMISANQGLTWDSTCIWNDTTKRAVFPQGGIYNPVGNTNIANAYVVGTGATMSSSIISGNFYASKPIGPGTYNNSASNVVNATQFFSNTSPPSFGKHDMACHSFCVTDDGVAKSLALLVNDVNATTNTGYGISGAMLVQGNFSGGVFGWSGTTFTPNVVSRTDGSLQMANKVLMAWNNAGTVGYVVMIGALQTNTMSNRGWQPIVYKTVNSGASWSLVPSMNFNSPFFQALKDAIKPVATNTNLVIPHFNIKEGIDATVDFNDALHIAGTVVGTASNHKDSLDYTYRFGTEGYQWPHVPGARPVIYDFVTNGSQWTYSKIDELSSEIPGTMANDPGYVDNPWDTLVGGKKVASGARIQLSRAPDGKMIIYTYTESDTNFTNGTSKWNTLPHIKAKAYIAHANNLLNDKINITKPATGQGTINPQVHARATFHFASPVTTTASGTFGGFVGLCYTSTETASLALPMTVSNSNPFQQNSKNDHWFSMVKLKFQGNNGANSFPPYDTWTGIDVDKNSPGLFSLSPNPAMDNVRVDMLNTSFEDYTIQVSDVTGKVLLSEIHKGEVIINTSTLNNGVYIISVYKDHQLFGTKKLMIVK